MEPVMFLQWLPDDEYKEALAVLVDVSNEINVRYRDVQCKDQALAAICEWLDQDNAQYLFIGAHGIKDGGDCIGIGATGDDQDHFTWQELWGLVHGLDGGLWLGACRSSECAAGFDPFLGNSAASRHPYIVGFSEDICAGEIEKVLRKFVEFAQRADIHVDEEINLIRAEIGETSVEMFYPARLKPGERKYVSEEAFPEEVGRSLRDFLKTGAEETRL